MATVFESYRLFLNKEDVPITADQAKDLEVYGSCWLVIDDDLAVMLYEHEEDYVFVTVGVELESSPTGFANMVHKHFDLPESVSGKVISLPLD